MKSLKVVGRYLAYGDGTPFFFLADTAWELFHRLNRDEMAHYFSVRARQGFTAIQAVALSEFEGLTVPNAYGRLPLLFTDGVPDPDRPDVGDGYSYWAHVDYAVDAAAQCGLFMTLLPTWGDKFNLCWGKGPVVFNEANAYRYGNWIAKRYRDCWNIIWMLGGDRPLEREHRAIIDAMAKGIRDAGDTHLITFHPPGARNSTEFVGDAEYIDFHTSQTGHGIEFCYRSDEMMRSMEMATDKPFLDSEPRYEDHPACFNDTLGYLWNAQDVRQNAYWDVLAGACGHTYGNHCIWSMTREPTSYFPYSWKEALTHPGAEQMGHLKALRLRRDYFSLQGAQELIAGPAAGMGHETAAMGEGYGYVYSPLGAALTVDMDVFYARNPGKCVRALWFDPRTGEESIFAILPPKGRTMLAPPTQGKGCDWVLILEAIK